MIETPSGMRDRHNTGVPETRFARVGERPVAYRIYGDGPQTLVVAWGFFSHVETFERIPGYTHFVERLAAHRRVVTFDVTGTGASDRTVVPTFDGRLDDLCKVVDAVGTDRVALLGTSGGGALAVKFAAAFPERTEALVLYGAYPRFMASDDIFYMATAELAGMLRAYAPHWGRGGTADALAPSLAVSGDGRRLWRSVESDSVDASQALELFDNEATIDVVDLLGSVEAPTLVLHRVNEQFVPPWAARDLAARIRGARLVYIDGLDHVPWLGNADLVADEIDAFLLDDGGPAETNARLSAVLLTDIAGSTEKLIQLGDAGWSELLERHDEIVAEATLEDGASRVKSTGDGVLAVFDHPAPALRCATRLRDGVQGLGLDMKAGVTVGEVIFRPADVSGLCVHLAERLTRLARPGQILLSRGAAVLLGESHFDFIGLRTLKGVPGDRSVFQLV